MMKPFVRLFGFLAVSTLLTASVFAQTTTPEIITNPTPHNFEFVAFGDMGSGLPAQADVAKAMAQSYQQTPYGVVLMLGDNIYPVGNIDRYAQLRFQIPYAPLLNNGVRFMPALGNHDVIMHPTGAPEIKFYKMPARYYDYIDGDIHFFALDTTKYSAAQKTWLTAALAKNKQPWTVVYAHHPVFTSGMHGSSVVLQKELKPILEKYHVDLYLAGHDHDYERFAPVNGVHYIVSGGGGAELRPFKTALPGSLVRLDVHHFLRITLADKKMLIEAVDTDGKVVDSETIAH